MADTKISDLAAVTDLLDTDELVLARSGATKKIDGVDLRSELGGGLPVLFDETLGVAGTFDTDPDDLSGYAHLKIYLVARASPATTQQALHVRFNNDSGNNYTYQTYAATGGAVGAASASSQAQMVLGFMTAASSNANAPTGFVLEVPGYSGTVFDKTITLASSTPHGGTFSFLGAAGFWDSTAAITRIQMFPDSGDFIVGSRLTIYGMN